MTERSRLRWKNISGETMPAGAIFQIKEYIPGERAYEADKWDATATRWGINGQVDVENNGYGWFDRSQHEHIVLANQTYLPDFGRNCGPRDGQWYVDNKGGGFRFYGETLSGFLTGVEYIGVDIQKVKLQLPLAKANDSETDRPFGTAVMMQWNSSGELESDPTRTITVHNHYEGIGFDNTSILEVRYDVIEWHVLTSDCPE